MMVDRAPNLQFAHQLEVASQQIAVLKRDCESEDKRISVNIEELVNTLAQCNKTITQAITHKPDEETVRSINHFIEEARTFPFHLIEYQKSTIEKVNELQNGLFGSLFNQIQKLETNLRTWRSGRKVESTHKSKPFY